MEVNQDLNNESSQWVDKGQFGDNLSREIDGTSQSDGVQIQREISEQAK